MDTQQTFVSTGALPSRDEVRALVETAYARFRNERAGAVADYIPALAEADPAAFGDIVGRAQVFLVRSGVVEQA